jgi:hypothetical protein
MPFILHLHPVYTPCVQHALKLRLRILGDVINGRSDSKLAESVARSCAIQELAAIEDLFTHRCGCSPSDWNKTAFAEFKIQRSA